MRVINGLRGQGESLVFGGAGTACQGEQGLGGQGVSLVFGLSDAVQWQSWDSQADFLTNTGAFTPSHSCSIIASAPALRETTNLLRQAIISHSCIYSSLMLS